MKLNKKFLKELEALAEKYGMQVLHECSNCGATQESPVEVEQHFYITLTKLES